MEIDEERVRRITAEVLQKLRESGAVSAGGVSAGAEPTGAVTAAHASPSAPADPGTWGVFSEMESAVGAAREAHRDLVSGSLVMRRAVIAAMRRAVLENLESISREAMEETGFGRTDDKIAKNRLAAEMTPGVEDLEPTAYTDDHGLTLVERAPYGVIGAIAPSTNPTETIINNGIGMVAGGNAVVFNAHPAAKKISARVVALLNQAAVGAGGPANLICTIREPGIETAQLMMRHPGINLLVVTGGPGVVKEAMATDKKVIAAGPGNPPCVVDETADLVKAGRDIVRGAGFDNNIICICEKEVLAVESIADPLKGEMKRNGAFELTSEQTERVTRLVISDPGRPGHEGAPNKKFVGKNAAVIAQAAGIQAPADARILLCEVDRNHPLVWTEQLMPVIPLTRFRTADEAIDFAVECEHGFRHTASIHSLNIARLSRMARVMNCSLFVKNGSNFNGMAAGGAGFTSFTIASPTGEGFTRARTFTRERRCSLIDYFRIV